MPRKEEISPISSVPNSHRETFFEINKGVYLVPGFSRAAVCDTTTGNVYSINRLAQEVTLGLKKDDKF